MEKENKNGNRSANLGIAGIISIGVANFFLTAVVEKTINGGFCEVEQDPLDGVPVVWFGILTVLSDLTNRICDVGARNYHDI